MEYKTTLEQDIEAIKKIIRNEMFFSPYNCLYSWTNEVLPSYYNYENLKGKKVACPSASGDHPIHAAMGGANYIDAYDINPLAKYYSALKIAILRAYDYNHMLSFLSKPYLSCNINLNDFKEYLTDKQTELWKQALKEGKKMHLNTLETLFRNDGYYSPLENNCDFFNKKGFDLVQKNLEKAKINYHDLDIADPNQIKNLTKYNVLFLSNIHEYVYNRRYTLAKNCSDLLLPNGVLYQYHCCTNPDNLDAGACLYFNHESKIITIKNIDGCYGENCGVNVYRKK